MIIDLLRGWPPSGNNGRGWSLLRQRMLDATAGLDWGGDGNREGVKIGEIHTRMEKQHSIKKIYSCHQIY